MRTPEHDGVTSPSATGPAGDGQGRSGKVQVAVERIIDRNRELLDRLAKG